MAVLLTFGKNMISSLFNFHTSICPIIHSYIAIASRTISSVGRCSPMRPDTTGNLESSGYAHTRKESRRSSLAEKDARARRLLPGSQSTSSIRTPRPGAFSGGRGGRRGGGESMYTVCVCVCVCAPCILPKARTHPRARACARKGTRPEYFIFTYQRWALCAVYIKSRYSYGMSIRQGLRPSRHSPRSDSPLLEHIRGVSASSS